MTNEILAEFLEDLKTIVNIDGDSKNPDGTNQVAAFFKKKFEEIGWIVREHHVSDKVGTCLEVVNCESDKYDVLMMGHMDTVLPYGSVKERPFTITGNRATGPGVYDMKSGSLLAFYLCREMDKKGLLKGAAICVALNSDEEISSIYSRPFLETLIKKSRYALVLEGGRSNGNLVNQRKGIGKYLIELHGKAVHAGVEPENGASAIHELLLRGQEVLTWSKPEIGTTINIGVVKGGTVPNTVADYASMEIDVRITTKEEGERIEKLFGGLANNVQTKGVTITKSGTIRRPPLDPSADSLKFCAQIDKIKERLGLTYGWSATGGGSDGNFASALGVPTVDALGPVGGGAHGVDEYMDVDSIIPRAQLVEEIIKYCITS